MQSPMPSLCVLVKGKLHPDGHTGARGWKERGDSTNRDLPPPGTASDGTLGMGTAGAAGMVRVWVTGKHRWVFPAVCPRVSARKRHRKVVSCI